MRQIVLDLSGVYSQEGFPTPPRRDFSQPEPSLYSPELNDLEPGGSSQAELPHCGSECSNPTNPEFPLPGSAQTDLPHCGSECSNSTSLEFPLPGSAQADLPYSDLECSTPANPMLPLPGSTQADLPYCYPECSELGRNKLESDDMKYINLSDIEGTCCYCSEDALPILDRAAACSTPVWWIDTGDYHYLSYLHARRLTTPFVLVLLDNHSDDFDLCDMLSCGNWVKALCNEKHCKVHHIKHFKDISSIDSSSPLPLFLSIDLDVLREEDFKTNWDQGDMTWEELLEIVRTLASSHKICGIDICGGITESKGAHGHDLSLNVSRRLQLSSLLSQLPELS